MGKFTKLLKYLLIAVFVILVFHFNPALAGEKQDINSKIDLIQQTLDDQVIPRLETCCGGILITGQMVSNSDGDDGYWQKGMYYPNPRFTDNDDGTITDNFSKLMWTKNAQQIPGEMIWDEALDACNILVFASYDDWRMPNVREMLSLIDYGNYNPALPDDHPFENVPSYPGRFWSSTTLAVAAGNAFHVPISNGTVNHYSKTNIRYVWAVRAGK
jgi:hypothetical protein